MLKGLPAAVSVECEILGICINNASVIDEVICLLHEEDFYYEKHKIIFKALKNLYSNSISIDTITVIEELKKENNLEKIGGISYLAEITSSALEFNNTKEYINIIKDKSKRRKLIEMSYKTITQSTDQTVDVKEIVNNIENNIISLENVNANNIYNIEQVLSNVIEIAEKNYLNGGGITGISTKFKTLDKTLSGLNKQDLIILAARPSMGKTAFALNLAYNISEKYNVAIFSLEMSAEQLTQRILASASCIELEKIKNGNLNEKEWEKLTKYSALIASRNLVIDDCGTQTVNDIKAKCKNIKIKQNLDVVFIDYLQLIEGEGKNRIEDVTVISRRLKQLAKDLDVTVVALSQLSRAPEQRNDHRPILSDLRESGSIEQDADVVMFLYRDAYYNAETENTNLAECILAKNRQGKIGTVRMSWIGEYQKFATLFIDN